MLKSIRWRLLLWYAAMLLVVIAGFATYLYWSAERAAIQQFDVRLEGAARYLERGTQALSDASHAANQTDGAAGRFFRHAAP